METRQRVDLANMVEFIFSARRKQVRSFRNIYRLAVVKKKKQADTTFVYGFFFKNNNNHI